LTNAIRDSLPSIWSRQIWRNKSKKRRKNCNSKLTGRKGKRFRRGIMSHPATLHTLASFRWKRVKSLRLYPQRTTLRSRPRDWRIKSIGEN